MLSWDNMSASFLLLTTNFRKRHKIAFGYLACLLPRKNGYLFFTLLVFFQQTVFSQNVDSLKALVGRATDTTKARLFIELAEACLNKSYNPNAENNPNVNEKRRDLYLNQALFWLEQGDSLSKKLDYGRGIAIALYLRGDIASTKSLKNIPLSVEYFLKALPLLKKYAGPVYISQCYFDLASSFHWVSQLDRSQVYYDSAIEVFRSLKDSSRIAECLIWTGHNYFDKGDYKNAYLFGTRALEAAKNTGDTALQVVANIQLVELFLQVGLPQTAIDYFHITEALKPLTPAKDGKPTIPYHMVWCLWEAGAAYLKMNQVDSALYISRFIPEDTTDGDSERFYGQLYMILHQDEKALKIYVNGFEKTKESGHDIGTAGNAVELGEVYLKRKDLENALYYTRYGFSLAEKIHARLELRNAAATLSDIYVAKGDYKQAWHFSQLSRALTDSLASNEDRRKLSVTLVQTELENQKQQRLLLSRENEIKQQQLNTGRILTNISVGGAIVLALVAIIIFRNYRQKKKANNLLEVQKQEIQSTLSELKSTQAQLIQSEKMASLGELTAGVAHEIQNPLNFVNNFSDINKDLLAEIKEEISKGNKEEANAMVDTLIENEQKINHHGKRAEGIVKGMLQHSRSGSGTKELTDINRLADEYLRLAYHGFRAREKNIDISVESELDPGIGLVSIVQQDIGRVLLNLFNNAFYAVQEKLKTVDGVYRPVVKVVTRKLGKQIEISVKDNGNGIPSKIIDKIFQPFFTTKPTGQGTGLGLSLSYDIIKAHGGDIKVSSEEGMGSEFEIILKA
jgi:two-component system, NtrC family, sensor kinase